MMDVTAKYIQHEDGTYSAYIVEIDGINTQGATLEEAEANLRDAFDMMITYRREKRQRAKNIIYRSLSLR